MDEVVKLMFSIASVWNAPLGENMLRVSPDIALLVANFPSIRGGGLIVEACGTSWTGSSKYTSIRAEDTTVAHVQRTGIPSLAWTTVGANSLPCNV